MRITHTINGYRYERDANKWYHKVELDERFIKIRGGDVNYLTQLEFTLGHVSEDVAKSLAAGQPIVIIIVLPD